MIKEKKWAQLFGVKRRENEATNINQVYCNLAYAIQQVTEEIILKMAAEAKRITSLEYLCLVGGVALNCVANGKLLKSGIFKAIYIQPAAGDAGGALGAALAINHLYFDKERKKTTSYDLMNGTYLGPDYSSKEIVSMSRKMKAVYKQYSDFEALCLIVASKLAKGKVVGWFQGRMEFGPRALGNRSILGDPRSREMQKKINLKIKFREGFRPFAPSVLNEDVTDYFDIDAPSPYMLLVAAVNSNRKITLPPNYNELSIGKIISPEK